jgi:hypothetical protein
MGDRENAGTIDPGVSLFDTPTIDMATPAFLLSIAALRSSKRCLEAEEPACWAH